MKEKITTFIIGLIIGALLASAGFLVYNNFHKNDLNNNRQQMENRGTPPTNGVMPDRSNGNSNKKPSSNTVTNTMEESM